MLRGRDSAGQQLYHSQPYPPFAVHDSHHVEQEPTTISIQGLTSGYIQPLDFCVPVTRSHPGDENQRREALHGDTGRNLAVEHIDISTAWNGLSEVDAKELFRVHRAFVSTLENMLANELWQIYQQLQQQDSAGNIAPIHTLFSAGIVRGISFCRDQLVSEMAEALYSSKENKAKAKSGFLRLYLIATDALVQYHEHGSRDTSVTVRVRSDPSSSRSYPVVDAAWVPDSLMFEGLDQSPREGQSFSIVPRYYSKSAFRPTCFPKNVKYSIESESPHSPLSWLVWDDEIAGFKGVVPHYSEVNSYDRNLTNTGRSPCEGIPPPLRIIVQAMLVDDNGSSIRYERTLRARLSIKVVPWYAIDNPRKTEGRSSVPKAYEAVRGPGESLQERGPSPSTQSRWRRGAHRHVPTKHAHLSEVGFKDNRSTMSDLAEWAGSRKTYWPSPAQTQAYLVAKCAELKRELENVREQVMMSDGFGQHHDRTLHVPYPRAYPNDIYWDPFCHRTGHHGATMRSSVPCTAHDASEHPTTPPSPCLGGRDATFQLEPDTRFSVLPPPATGLRARPALDSQISNNGNAMGVTGISRDPASRPGTAAPFTGPEGGFTTSNTRSTQVPTYSWNSPEQASIASNDTGTAHSSPRHHVEAPSTPRMVKSELATLSSSGQRGRKRRANSGLDDTSPFERSGKTGKQPKQDMGAHSAEPDGNTLPLSDSEDGASSTPTPWSSLMFYNSFDPLRHLGSSTTLAGEDAQALYASGREASTNSRKDIKHRQPDLGFHRDTDIMESGARAGQTSPVHSGLDDDATTVESAFWSSLFPDWEAKVDLCQSSSASFSPRHASTSSTNRSRSASSDTEFIVEQDPCARKVSRREQARLWKLLSQSDGDKENRPRPEGEEVRLSEDEKKAMEEAVQRSLDDLTEGFDDIFLQDDSESSSDDDEL